MSSIDEIASKIIDHMMRGVIFHTQLSEYYNFLSLYEFSYFHSCQAEEEFKKALKFQKRYMDCEEKLIPSIELKPIDTIVPQNWYSHKREDIDASTIREGTKTGFEKWIEWETETKKLYEDSAKEVDSDYWKMIFTKMGKEVGKELLLAKKDWLYLKVTNYDILQILSMQGKK